jgi:hypothetical protein
MFSIESKRIVIASTGVASTCMIEVAYSAQILRGSLPQEIPGARSLWIVVMKFVPVRIEENPRINTPKVTQITPAEFASEE